MTSDDRRLHDGSKASGHRDLEPSPQPPLLALSPRLRRGLALALLGLAVVHLLLPDLAIDGVFLGLIAFAGLVWFFDFESIEWLGIKAQRRDIDRAQDALAAAQLPATQPEPEPPKIPPPGVEVPNIVTVHMPPMDLTPPEDKLHRLVWGTEQIRIELIVLLGSAGHLTIRKPWSEYTVGELAQDAARRGIISKALLPGLQTVVRMRHQAVHTEVVDPASDLAMDLLQSLRALHRTYVRVRRGHISIYRDPSLTTPYSVTHGVMIARVGEDGAVPSISVFPRNTDYADGRFLTWEWDITRAFREEAWFEDPSTSKPQLAWSEAATFIGREFPQQWGLEFRLQRSDDGLLNS